MAVADIDARILDSLKQIFPQLDDHVLSNCIRNVRGSVGSDPATVIPGCIDVLLAQQTVHVPEVPQPPPPRHPSLPPIFLDHDENGVIARTGNVDEEVIFVRSTTSVRDLKNERRVNGNPNVIDLIDESEWTFGNSPSAMNNSRIAAAYSQENTGNGHTKVPTGHLPSGSILKNPRATSTATVPPSVTIVDPQPCDVQALAVNVEPPFDYMEDALKNLHSLFPDVEDSYLQGLVEKWSHLRPYEAINNACNELLETRDYPKKPSTCIFPAAVTSPSVNQKPKDYLKDFSSQVSNKYSRQCFEILRNEFRTIPVKYIRRAMAKFSDHYAPSKRYLQEQLRVSSGSATSTTPGSLHNVQSQGSQLNSSDGKNVLTPPKVEFLKNVRSPRLVCAQCDMADELKSEIDFMESLELSKTEEMDRRLAASLNDEQYELEGQKIECGCCYGDAAFEDMVQCLEGHLFCASCLMNYAKEAAFGQGKAALTCMSDSCDGTFPLSQLRKALPTNILEKYEDRVQEESLLMAQMEDFVRCPSCDFAAILPLEDKVLKCQNPSCGKETCRYCKEEWSEHFGLKCNEVEKSAQKDVRLSYEEKMTMAKIRKCSKCGCEFTKSDGCNKMTCRCGTTMCYICRKPSIHYNHFCQHPKDPGKSCSKCTSCSLWTDPSEDDNRAVKELEKEALEAKRKFEEEEEKVKLDGNPAKRVKTC